MELASKSAPANINSGPDHISGVPVTPRHMIHPEPSGHPKRQLPGRQLQK
jgi:hypothetical protein